MKNKFIYLIVLIIITTNIIPPYSIFASDIQCENKAFSMQAVNETDEKITGNGTPSERIEIKFLKHKAEVFIDNNGKFEHEVKEGILAEGDRLMLSNDYHEIETVVAGDDTPKTKINSHPYIECVSETTLDTEAEEPINNELTEEIVKESEAVEAAEDSQDVLTQENSSSEEGHEEITNSDFDPEVTVMEENPESEVSDQVDNGSLKTPVISDEELDESEEMIIENDTDDSSKSAEEPEPAQREHEDYLEPELQEFQSNNENTDRDANRSDDSIEIALKVEKKYESESTVERERQEESQPEKKDEAVTDTLNETEHSVKNDKVEIKKMDSTESKRVSFAAIQNTIDEEMRSSRLANNVNFKSLLEDESVEYIMLTENISVNDIIDVTSASHKKTIDGQGEYTLDLGEGQLYLDDGLLFSRTGEIKSFHLKNIPNVITKNVSKNDGLIKKRNRTAQIYWENVNFNRDNLNNAGMLGSSWESEIFFQGDNIINSNLGKYVMAFSKVTVKENSTLIINNLNGNTVFYYDNGTLFKDKPESYGITVDTNGTLQVNSNSLVIDSELSGQRKLNYRFGNDSRVQLQGYGSYILGSSSDSDMFTVDPDLIELVNHSGGRIFNSKEDVRFFIMDATMKSWSADNISGDPDSISNHIEEGKFQFSGDTLVYDSGLQEDFDKLFNTDSPKIVFEENIDPIAEPEVGDIYSGDKVIKGNTVANAAVTMYDENEQIISTVTSNSKGDFEFTVEDGLELDRKLVFAVTKSHIKSPKITKVVIGTELNVPDNINFKKTEISAEETIVQREQENMSVSVFDNRPNGDWKLSAQAEPLSNESSALSDALYFVEDGNWNSIEHGALEISKESDLNSNTKITELNWGADERILLKLNPVQVQAETDYSTTIEWTLTDGP